MNKASHTGEMLTIEEAARYIGEEEHVLRAALRIGVLQAVSSPLFAGLRITKAELDVFRGDVHGSGALPTGWQAIK